MADELHVFFNEGDDYVIARDADDARAILVEHGYCPEDVGEITQWPDDKPFSCRRDEGDSQSVRQSVAGWVAENGRGFFCSENW